MVGWMGDGDDVVGMGVVGWSGCRCPPVVLVVQRRVALVK